LVSTSVTSVALGHAAYGVAVSLDGTFAYATRFGGNAIDVIDTETLTILKTITVGTGPIGVAFDPTGSGAAVACATSGTVCILNTTTHTVVTEITVGLGPYFLKYSNEGLLLVGLNGEANVARVKRATLTVDKISAQANPAGIAISPDGNLLCAVGRTASKVSIIDKV
jgi:YVTN family beta-propeller protein